VPAIPELSRKLGSDIATVQLTVSVYLLAIAAGQLIMGPLSDRFGRRPVLLAGLALTAAASVLAVAMSTATSLIVARILQAIGASAGIVVGRAIIRDLFDRDRAASMIGLVATVMVVMPSIGPLIGGVLDTAFGWESIFIFAALASLIVLAWTAVTLPETSGMNAPAGIQEGFLRDLRFLAVSRSFIGYVLAASLGSATFFAFLGGSPHVIITLMDYSSAEYGVWFALSSIGYMAGNFAASRISVRYGIYKPIWWGIAIEGVGVAAATLLAATAHDYGAVIVFLPQAHHLVRQRCDAAGRDRGRGQRAAAGGRHRGGHRRLFADVARRRHGAIRRHAAFGRGLGAAAGADDGGDRGAAGRVLRAAGAPRRRRLESLGQILRPLRADALVQRLAGARDGRERLLAPERNAGVDDDARIAPVVGGVVAHRIERRRPAAADDVHALARIAARAHRPDHVVVHVGRVDVVVDHDGPAVAHRRRRGTARRPSGLLGVAAVQLLDRDTSMKRAAAGLVRPHALDLGHAGGFELVPHRAAAVGAAVERVVVRRHAGIAPSRIGSSRYIMVSTRIAGSRSLPPA
jgi:Bcr/CflA subfamily drug resistance transporter